MRNSTVLLIFFLLLITSTACCQDRSIIILDASGSMWGQVDGRPKIEIAREVLRKLLKSWPDKNPVGLMAYGHRSKGDCNDIEEIIPPGPLDRAHFEKVVAALQPKGKTPMTEAVRRAAQALRSTESRATVILISDGEETCDANPCDVAKELERTGVEFTAHVVGFDLKHADQRARDEMRCLAELTGGKFLEADSANELLQALRTVVATPTPVPATPTAAVTATPLPTSTPRPTSTPEKPKENLVARAVLSEGGELLTKDLTWKLSEKSLAGDGKRVGGNYDPQFKQNVPPGKYVLEVHYGSVRRQQEVTVTEEPQLITVNLNAGIVKARAMASEGGEILSKDVGWRVDVTGKSEQVAGSYDATPEFILPTGQYDLVARWGEAKTVSQISVEPGKVTSIDVVLGGGVLSCTAFAVEGGEKLTSNLRYTVRKGKQALSGEFEQVTGSYDADPSFKLPAGEYRLEVGWGEAHVVKEGIKVNPGERTEVAVVLNSGSLALSVATTAPIKSVRWSVVKATVGLDGRPIQVGSSYDLAPTFLLPSGDYKITLLTDGKPTELQATVIAGQRTEKSVTPAP